jgi:hypothetical protein
MCSSFCNNGRSAELPNAVNTQGTGHFHTVLGNSRVAAQLVLSSVQLLSHFVAMSAAFRAKLHPL